MIFSSYVETTPRTRGHCKYILLLLFVVVYCWLFVVCLLVVVCLLFSSGDSQEAAETGEPGTRVGRGRRGIYLHMSVCMSVWKNESRYVLKYVSMELWVNVILRTGA